MRVAQVLYSGLGGHGSVALSLAGTASATGAWDCAMVFMGIEETLPAYRHACAANGYRHLEIRTRPWQAWRSWPSFYRALDALAPDVIVLHSVKAILPAALYAWRRSIPLVAVEHQPNNITRKSEWWVSRWLQQLADAVWADSEASMRLRFRRAPRAPVTVIPFLTHHLTAGEGDPGAGDPVPTFAFWGRLAGQKNLFRALELFRAVHRVHRGARFSVIGPDCGERSKLEAWCAHAGLSQAVHFIGPLSSEAIREVAQDHCFYLQTSDYEGMAMSVVEAMQLGLVPVVTPVGEIRAYCRDGENAIVVGDVGAAAADVLRVLDDPARWRALRRQALETWRGAPLYRDAVAAACRRLSPACVR